MHKENIVPVLFVMSALLLFVGGVVLGSVINGNPGSSKTEATSIEIHNNKGTLTSPLLVCDTSTAIGSREFSSFERTLNSAVDTYIGSGKATHVAIYFRNLLDGAWFGIKEKEIFTPASLLKVPAMIAVFKQVESDPTLLDQKLKYERVYDQEKPYFEPQEQLEIGKEYTVDELISRMIRFSDNEAMFLLREKSDPKLVENLYKDLRLIPPDESIFNDFMTIKDYSSFFRILFNASYLSVPLSNKALALLTSIQFNQGISAGLTPDIVVAHKFGERTYTDDNSKQLHDCGIVYFPNNPYMLCVMTKGKDFEMLASVIRDISKKVLDEIKIRSNENK